MHVFARFAAIVAGLAVVLTGLSAASPANAADRDCGDFASQKAAQIFFLKAGGPRRDPHGLDGSDNDGRACESNPAPYYYGKSLPGGGGGKSKPKPRPKPKPKVVREQAIVTKVIDGDTIRVKITPRGYRKDVRLIGIDTPEVYGGTQCFGPQASSNLKRLLPRNTRVTLTSDPTQDRSDRYGRILRYVVKNRGRMNINRQQVWNGSARVYVYGGKPFQQVRRYRSAQRNAQRADRGLWGQCR